ncbi:MAG: MATE family efflux transporter [Treponema sp.]|nr:MATE family efflux transporter [Treponema sp.]
MKDKAFYSKLFRLTLPISVQSLMLASVAAADTFMLGNVEQNMMSAVSLATQIQFIQNMFIFAAVGASSILGAQYWGKNDRRSVNDIFCFSLKVCGLISFVFFVMCVFFPNPLMTVFTNDTELNGIGCRYLRIAGWSYLLTGFIECYLTIMKISDKAKHSACISSVTVILNIVLNAIFIFGLLDFSPMGVQGAALATLISRIVEFLWAVLISLRKDFISPDIKSLFSVNKALAFDFVKCSLPLLGAGLFWGVGFTSYTAFMGHLGQAATASNSIASVVRDLVCCACNGIASAAGIIVGNELGAGNLDKGRYYGNKLAKISFVLGVLSTALMFALTPIVVHFIKLSEEAQGLLVGMMCIMAVYMIGRCINSVIINGIFAAGGDTLFDMYSLAVCMWGVAVPLAFLGTFVFHWNVLVIYACTCLDEVGKIPWVIHHFRRYRWVKDLTRN